MWVEGRADGRAFLLDIFVTRTARRGGVGRRLLRQALESTQVLGRTELRLAVSGSNHGAQMLFRSLGFRETDQEIREGVTWFEMARSAI